MRDARPRFTSAQSSFGVSADVTVPGGQAVTTTIIWHPPRTIQTPIGHTHQRAETIREVGISKADVPTLPLDTVISAPEFSGGSTKTWKVDGTTERFDDHHRATVREVA